MPLVGTLNELRQVPKSYASVVRIDPEDVRNICLACQAFWQHNGNTSQPHALLASGKHSDGYVNLSLVLKYPEFCELIGASLATQIKGVVGNDFLKNWGGKLYIAGVACAGITPSYVAARELRAIHIYAEKGDDPEKMKCRFDGIGDGLVIQVGDLETTLSSTAKAATAIKAVNPNACIYDPAFAIVNRSGQETLMDRRVYSLLAVAMNDYPADDCPLCKGGSKPIKPKQNWAKFATP